MASSALSKSVRPQLQEIRVALAGPEIDETYPLRSVLDLLERIASIVELYTQEVSAEELGTETGQVTVSAGFPHRGSYTLVLYLSVGAGVSAAVALGPKVLQLSAKVVEVFMWVMNALKKGENPTASLPDANGNVIISSGSGNLTVNQTVLNLAVKSEAELKGILERLEPSRIDTVKLSADESPDVSLTSADRTFIAGIRGKPLRALAEHELPTSAETFEVPLDEFRLMGELLSFDKVHKRGEVKVLQRQLMPEGVYKFRMERTVSSDAAIVALRSAQVSVSCRVDRSKGKLILRIFSISEASALGA
jgi:hypothetical protein